MEEKLRCSVCGVNLSEKNSFEFGGEILCQHCLDEKSVICDCCGTRISRECAQGDEYTVLCNNCYNNRYTNCENCGVLIHNNNAYCIDDDDDYYYCSDCYEKLKNRPIKSYNYKPETKFYGEGNLFYGIEVEIDKGGEFDENAQKILDVGNSGGEKIYCKHDGSIEDGFEIVSHAATIDYHLSCFPWKDIMTKAIEMGYRSHNTSTCGLHIHASRSAFGKTYEQQEEVIARIVHFVELPDGNIVYSKFDYKDYCGFGFRNWWDYGMYCSDSNSYMDDLKSVAVHMGISPDDMAARKICS